VMGDGGCQGVVARRFFSGSDDIYCIRLETGERVRCRQPAGVDLPKGSTVRVRLLVRGLPSFPD